MHLKKKTKKQQQCLTPEIIIHLVVSSFMEEVFSPY